MQKLVEEEQIANYCTKSAIIRLAIDIKRTAPIIMDSLGRILK